MATVRVARGAKEELRSHNSNPRTLEPRNCPCQPQCVLLAGGTYLGGNPARGILHMPDRLWRQVRQWFTAYRAEIIGVDVYRPRADQTFVFQADWCLAGLDFSLHRPIPLAVPRVFRVSTLADDCQAGHAADDQQGRVPLAGHHQAHRTQKGDGRNGVTHRVSHFPADLGFFAGRFSLHFVSPCVSLFSTYIISYCLAMSRHVQTIFDFRRKVLTFQGFCYYTCIDPPPEDATMPVMAKKKPKQKRTGVSVFAYIDKELRDALDQYLEAAKPSPSLTAALETAIEEFLANRGFWPPPEDQPPPA